jgi:hypothetical protein
MENQMEGERVILRKLPQVIHTKRTEPGRMINDKHAWENQSTGKIHAIVELCQYTYKKGAKQGTLCLEPVMDGRETFCNIHRK